MAHLIRNPEVMQRAQPEFDAVIGIDRVVCESDLEHLRYLEAVVKEVLRGGSGSDGLFQLMALGAGRRICPGLTPANINMCHILAHLLHCFDWRLPGGANPWELDMVERFDGMTAPRLHPLLAVAHPRKPAYLY